MLLAKVVPQIHKGEEVGLFIVETTMLLVRGLLLVHRPLARILNRERRGDDHRLAHAAVFCASSTIRARRGSTGSWLSWRPIGVSL